VHGEGSLNYCFCTQICEWIGDENAAFLQNPIYWRCYNKANKKSQRDSRTWSYNTLDLFRKLFSFRSVKLREIITSMNESGQSSGVASMIGRPIDFPLYRFGLPVKTKEASLQNKTYRMRFPLHVMNTTRRLKPVSNP
jgi:hypothetical protein